MADDFSQKTWPRPRLKGSYETAVLSSDFFRRHSSRCCIDSPLAGQATAVSRRRSCGDPGRTRHDSPCHCACHHPLSSTCGQTHGHGDHRLRGRDALDFVADILPRSGLSPRGGWKGLQLRHRRRRRQAHLDRDPRAGPQGQEACSRAPGRRRHKSHRQACVGPALPWGPLYKSKEEMEDWKLAGWAADFLQKPQSEPFFLACGIVKPHTPWFVPQEYFDLFPPERITVPDLAADENAGLPQSVREKTHKTEAELIQRRKELISAYLASSRYADDCVGRILQGLAAGPNREHTIVVICGDNGYEFGEKHNWSKGSLREGSARVPLVIAGPGIGPQQTCTHPVSLLDLFPTLVELAGLPAKSGLDGVSLMPLLKNPAASWERPALTTVGFKNHALRTDRWRYIRYADGAEELYDHDNDPLERTNLATKPEAAKIKADLQPWLPKHDEPRNPNSEGGKGDD
ncbi:MAG: hypothetical protein B7Z47_00120 [Chthoniobacter sp. 12-60-6]|nr:MAG: hypothetical protein B7Z47_00120 [Chthoniobacter sp. 12-60-6]